jgi:hypothetical protein
MRTKNFFKGLAVAAVALVGVFATSCSEEELNVQSNVQGPSVNIPDPTPLPAGVAYAAISVVDLGDMGLSSKVLYTEIKDVTALNGTEIECPDFDGMEEYVIPAAQKISVPTLSAGQTVTIPMTFYVVKTTSAFAQVEWDVNNAKDWGWSEEGAPYVYSEETWLGTEEKDLQNLSNYWKDIQVRYSVPYAYFVEVLGETEAPEGGEGEGTEGEEGEGTEGEGGEGEGTEGEGGEGEGTEGEEGGEGEATEGEVVLSFDFEDAEAKTFFSWNLTSFETAEGVFKAIVPEAANPWEAQLAYDVTTPFTLDQEYKVVFKVKGSAEGKATLDFQTPSGDLGYPVAGQFGDVNITTDWTDVELTTTCTRDDATRLIFSFGGTFAGDLYIDDFQLIAVAPAAKAAATTADEIVAAYVKNIVMPEYGVEGDSYNQIAGPVTLFSGGCVDFTKTIYSTKPTYVFTYMGEEVEVTFEQIMYAFGVLGTPYAIPGHETEYSHSEGHGHYQHDQHGNHMNAGGGIVSFE